MKSLLPIFSCSDLLRLRFCLPAFLFAAILFAAISEARTVEMPTTETLLLSGSGSDAPVEWEFRCNEGRGCGSWTKIPVPSQWELQGFGAYNYGHDEDKADEIGEYRKRFEVPADWIEDGRTIELIFEGVMTDADVRVNGRSAGPIHQGAFYRFRYDVTSLLQRGENLLEVEVRKMSRDRSVNLAERDADYWVFGGIYRPVWLRALPSEAIDAVAVHARHEGGLQLRITPRGLNSPASLDLRVIDPEGNLAAEFLGIDVASDLPFELMYRLSGVLPWSAENPHLYHLEWRLHRGGETLHSDRERFGFRTVEVRSDGIYVNDRRTLLQGVNRHAFWPDTGRTLNAALDRKDAEMIKAMNFNAVRASHYPPDKSFLEACDEIGLYVIDELTGWHDAYTTEVGEKLVREMVERDRNHPSILFWANGNEDGWNTDLDDDFALYDLQKRVVLHPDVTFGGFDTEHYPTWKEFTARLDEDSMRNRLLARWYAWTDPTMDGLPLVMPTEILHGLYDGGHGGGIDDYWERLRRNPRAAGMFLWVFSDEAIVRTDQGGILDTDGNHAPDGIVGPYREASAQMDAIRRAFSPIFLLGQSPILEGGPLRMENRFAETDLADCHIHWAWARFPGPEGSSEDLPEIDDLPEIIEGTGLLQLTAGTFSLPNTAPGAIASVPLPEMPEEADALHLAFYDPGGRLLDTRTIPRLDVRRQAPRWVVKEGDVTASFESEGEKIRRILIDGKAFSSASPAFVADVRSATEEGPAKIVGTREDRDGDALLFETTYDPKASGGLERATWRVEPSGWVRLNYSYRAEEGTRLHGIALPIPEEKIRSLTWLGQGPGRQWANRLQSGRLGVWTRDAAASTPPEAAHESKLRGYRKTYWARIETTEGSLVAVLEGDDQYFSLHRPLFPEDAKEARAASPASDGLLILHRIPAIGTKFHPPEDLGPQSADRDPGGVYQGVVWFYQASDHALQED